MINFLFNFCITKMGKNYQNIFIKKLFLENQILSKKLLKQFIQTYLLYYLE